MHSSTFIEHLFGLTLHILSQPAELVTSGDGSADVPLSSSCCSEPTGETFVARLPGL